MLNSRRQDSVYPHLPQEREKTITADSNLETSNRDQGCTQQSQKEHGGTQVLSKVRCQNWLPMRALENICYHFLERREKTMQIRNCRAPFGIKAG